MSELRVDNIVDMGGSGAPQLRKGANITGISTITQAVVGNATINAGGINATGVVTSTSNKFVGDFSSGNITAGVMTATSSVVASNITINSGGVNASGIVSATSYQGSGANLTGIGLSIAPLMYNPDVSAVDASRSTGIGLTFNQRVSAGVGTVTLSLVSVGSTVAEVFGLGNATSTTYTVTVASSKFYLDGNLQYSPTLYPGNIYTFDQSAGTNATHPLRFATAADAAGSTEYTTGVETNGTPGSSGAYTRITVAADAPDTLYYYCTNHSGMGSNVSIGANVQYNNDADPPNISITPKNSLNADTVYAINYPPGAFTQSGAGGSFVGAGYTFDTKSLENEAYGWAYVASGQLGNNEANAGLYLSSPVQVAGGKKWSNFTFGRYHHGGVDTDGKLWSWGYNTGGQVGDNSRVTRSSPIQIGAGTDWKMFQVSRHNTSFGIKTDGTLWAWGQNAYYGILGLNQSLPTKYSSPIQIPGTNWDHIYTGGYAAMALATKTDGTLWAWGGGNAGQLGQNEGPGNYYSSPVQIPGTDWATGEKKAVVSYAQAAAIKTNGELWAWGYNASGDLGQNNIIYYSSPVQIPGTNWSNLGAFSQSGSWGGIKTDGTLWVWGYNGFGVLGQNSQTNYSSPVQVPGTNWSASIIGGQNSGMATKTDGTLWAWGDSGQGGLGQNNLIKYSSPVQIPGTNWTLDNVNSYNYGTGMRGAFKQS